MEILCRNTSVNAVPKFNKNIYFYMKSVSFLYFDKYFWWERPRKTMFSCTRTPKTVQMAIASNLICYINLPADGCVSLWSLLPTSCTRILPFFKLTFWPNGCLVSWTMIRNQQTYRRWITIRIIIKFTCEVYAKYQRRHKIKHFVVDKANHYHKCVNLQFDLNIIRFDSK